MKMGIDWRMFGKSFYKNAHDSA